MNLQKIKKTQMIWIQIKLNQIIITMILRKFLIQCKKIVLKDILVINQQIQNR
jgi:hypothetical protein